jgi:methanogenic corrinoid protein MtbC1
MPIDDLVESARKLKPIAIVLSVMMSESANEITQLPTRLKAYAPDTYLFIGGNAFRNYIQKPNLLENKMVRYLGSDLYEGLAAIEQVLH